MKKIALFYHTVFHKTDGSPWPRSVAYNDKYMKDVRDSGLMAAQSHFLAGINGGSESEVYAKLHLPEATHMFHGLDCISANLTFDEIRKFSLTHPGWNVFMFHSKGLAHHSDDPHNKAYTEFENRWIKCMVDNLIYNWRTCVEDLETHDSVGCHWMARVGVPPVDFIWGGNMFWATSDFFATLPAFEDCPLVKQFGIRTLAGNSTGEQWIGLGPRLPNIKDYHWAGIGACGMSTPTTMSLKDQIR